MTIIFKKNQIIIYLKRTQGYFSVVFIYDKHLHLGCGILLQEKNNMDTAGHLKNLVLISDNTISDKFVYCILFTILNVNFCLCLLSLYKALEYLLV